jgi:hypothetical protein
MRPSLETLERNEGSGEVHPVHGSLPPDRTKSNHVPDITGFPKVQTDAGLLLLPCTWHYLTVIIPQLQDLVLVNFSLMQGMHKIINLPCPSYQREDLGHFQ